MKKFLAVLILILSIGTGKNKVHAQSEEAQQLLLNVEKLIQLKNILSDLKAGYQIVSKGYNTIKNISEGNFNLHKGFLDGLMLVSPAVRNYKRVGDIVSLQVKIASEYKQAYNRFKQDPNFTPGEMSYIATIYTNLFNLSLRNLEQLTILVTANKLRMSDDERLKGIDRLFADMQDKLSFLRFFNSNTTILALQRAKERKDIQTVRLIYGVKK